MKLKICHGFELKEIKADVYVLNLLSSFHLFVVILPDFSFNYRLAVEGLRLLKRNLYGSENLGGGGFCERLELVKTWGINTVRISD